MCAFLFFWHRLVPRELINDLRLQMIYIYVYYTILQLKYEN